ncbi:MAG: class I SAM-dependent methyltransferase [Actinomycetota bacterium]
MTEWTRARFRHAVSVLKRGANPAATVYDSIGSDFFLALSPGWLNLGLWEGPGTEDEAPVAVRRLVEEIAKELPTDAVILDVGNGLGVQDPVIAHIAKPRQLMGMNITESQLRAGREAMAEAAVSPLLADATRIPLADSSVDGVISVEAAFHFPSRRRFFAEAFRVLRPGGVLTMSDVPITRRLKGVRELLAGLSQLRLWGLPMSAAATPTEIENACRSVGFTNVETQLVGDRVIAPALRLTRRRLARGDGPAGSITLAARLFLSQAELLWKRGAMEYSLLRAERQ